MVLSFPSPPGVVLHLDINLNTVQRFTEELELSGGGGQGEGKGGVVQTAPHGPIPACREASSLAAKAQGHFGERKWDSFLCLLICV